MTKREKILVGLLLVVIVFALIICTSKESRDGQVVDEAIEAVVATPTPTPIVEEEVVPLVATVVPPMEEWDTHSNMEYNFEFKYPTGWKITGQDPIEGSYQVLARVVNPERAGKPDTDVPIEQFLVRRVEDKCQEDLSPVLGRRGYDSGWAEGFGLIYHRDICIQTDGWAISIYLGAYDEPSQKIMEDILSTVTFTE